MYTHTMLLLFHDNSNHIDTANYVNFERKPLVRLIVYRFFSVDVSILLYLIGNAYRTIYTRISWKWKYKNEWKQNYYWEPLS